MHTYFSQQNIDGFKIEISAEIPTYFSKSLKFNDRNVLKKQTTGCTKSVAKGEANHVGLLQEYFCILSFSLPRLYIHTFAKSRGDTTLLLFFINIMKISVRERENICLYKRDNNDACNQSEKRVSSRWILRNKR